MDGVETTAGATGAQLTMDIIAIQISNTKRLPVFLLRYIISPFPKDDKTRLNYKTVPGVCYNLFIMRYERSIDSYSCVGMRGFDSRGLPEIAPVA
jgi:hypothetical protein